MSPSLRPILAPLHAHRLYRRRVSLRLRCGRQALHWRRNPTEETGTPGGGDSEAPPDTGDLPVDADGDGVPAGEDCDDNDGSVYPAPKRCATTATMTAMGSWTKA